MACIFQESGAEDDQKHDSQNKRSTRLPEHSTQAGDTHSPTHSSPPKQPTVALLPTTHRAPRTAKANRDAHAFARILASRCSALTSPSAVASIRSMLKGCLEDLRATCCSCLLPPSSSPPPPPNHRQAMAAAEGDLGITHRAVGANGVRLHVAEAGPAGAPAVLLLHGFPELWYTWRHQMRALAAAGYRAVAPDMRGYGDSDAPSGGADQYTALHVVGDLVALIDSLGQGPVFVAAHDWGALTAWNLCLFRPDRVKALVTLSVPFTPRSPARKPVDGLRSLYGDDYYICRIQEPGAIEEEFARLGTELVLRKFFTYRNPGPLFIPKSGWGSPDDQVPLPSWITEEDVKYYASKFDKTGFTGGLNYYRALNKTWELTAPWTGAGIKVPTKFIIGDLDLTYHTPGVQDYISKGGLKKFVPLLDDVVIMKDVGHFIQEEKPEEVSEHIISFIKKFN